MSSAPTENQPLVGVYAIHQRCFGELIDESKQAMKVKIKDVAKAKKDWSLYRLAKELGLPQQTVYSWASGRTQPSYDNMDRLCDILDCPVGELFEAEPVQKKLF